MDKIKKIRRDWSFQKWILSWQQLPKERRDNVLHDIEEAGRQLAENDPQLARDYGVELDALEALLAVTELSTPQKAIEDIMFLLERVEK